MSSRNGDEVGGEENVSVRVAKAFPEWATRIENACRESPVFREICDDYVECDRVLAELRKSYSISTAKISDYEEMQTRLKEEIVNWIRKS